jgi:protein-tyrosine kinase
MSRIHEALRKAAQSLEGSPAPQADTLTAPSSVPVAPSDVVVSEPGIQFLADVEVVPFNPLPEALIVNPEKPREAPGEEFRTLRIRLNHFANATATS